VKKKEKIKAIRNLSIPHSNKTILAQKPQSIPEKT
jgi:hypothetical protein